MWLSQEKTNEIEFKSRALLDAVYPDGIDLPVDLSKILNYYGLKLFLANFSDKQVAGAYNREEKSIYVHVDDPRNRMVFTIAHELGHHVLHEGKKDLETFFRLSADLN
ncbi:ImmA/IrrE family metallo-endopeptidase [Oscillatoria amoena NRMC-F 0135]|nr:ImmA/IrrE family metallo-endopeptidase [Oscillatoria amoena NRMC-F 0135]